MPAEEFDCIILHPFVLTGAFRLWTDVDTLERSQEIQRMQIEEMRQEVDQLQHLAYICLIANCLLCIQQQDAQHVPCKSRFC